MEVSGKPTASRYGWFLRVQLLLNRLQRCSLAMSDQRQSLDPVDPATKNFRFKIGIWFLVFGFAAVPDQKRKTKDQLAICNLKLVDPPKTNVLTIFHLPSSAPYYQLNTREEPLHGRRR